MCVCISPELCLFCQLYLDNRKATECLSHFTSSHLLIIKIRTLCLPYVCFNILMSVACNLYNIWSVIYAVYAE